MTATTGTTTAQSNVRDDAPQHSVPAAIAYHLLPAVPMLAVAIAALPLVENAGFPPIAAMGIAILVAQLPLQLGYLLRLGYRRNGRLSLDGVVTYRNHSPRWQYPLWALGVLAVGIGVAYALTPLTNLLLERAFAWVPSGFTATTAGSVASLSAYSKTALIVTLGSMLILNGVAGPIVEELYFRGYLMPRLSRFGWKAPLLNTVLFTLYHMWEPWMYPTLLLTVWSFIFPTYWKRNIYIGMWGHIALNFVGGVATLALLFR
jgi:membrane protease YdiL (CAAX protease family)